MKTVVSLSVPDKENGKLHKSTFTKKILFFFTLTYEYNHAFIIIN